MAMIISGFLVIQAPNRSMPIILIKPSVRILSKGPNLRQILKAFVSNFPNKSKIKNCMRSKKILDGRGKAQSFSFSNAILGKELEREREKEKSNNDDR